MNPTELHAGLSFRYRNVISFYQTALKDNRLQNIDQNSVVNSSSTRLENVYRAWYSNQHIYGHQTKHYSRFHFTDQAYIYHSVCFGLGFFFGFHLYPRFNIFFGLQSCQGVLSKITDDVTSNQIPLRLDGENFQFEFIIICGWYFREFVISKPKYVRAAFFFQSSQIIHN